MAAFNEANCTSIRYRFGSSNMFTFPAPNIWTQDRSYAQVHASTEDIFCVFYVSFFESSDRLEVNCILIRHHFTWQRSVFGL